MKLKLIILLIMIPFHAEAETINYGKITFKGWSCKSLGKNLMRCIDITDKCVKEREDFKEYFNKVQGCVAAGTCNPLNPPFLEASCTTLLIGDLFSSKGD